MPVGTNPLAITEVDALLCHKVEVEKVLTETEPLMNQNDEVEEGDARDPIYNINLEGKGDLPDALVVGGSGMSVDGVTGGKTVVTNTKQTENNETYNNWSATAINGPAAS